MNNKKYIFTGLLVVLAIAVFLFITGVIEGEYAILQSYPEDKYVGGEGREPGDTKCDLNIRSTGTNMAELIQQWQTNDLPPIFVPLTK
jgi:hypothetical protein